MMFDIWMAFGVIISVLGYFGLKKVGLNPALAVIGLIPVIGLTALLFIFAFAKWPRFNDEMTGQLH